MKINIQRTALGCLPKGASGSLARPPASGKTEGIMSEIPTSAIKARFDEAGAKKMKWISREVFAPIYPVLAGQIKDRLGIASGWGLDIGAGPGSLGLALAEITDLKMILLDFSAPMVGPARESLAVSGPGRRCRITLGNVQALPLADNSLRLIVSRGSVFFLGKFGTVLSGRFTGFWPPSGKTYVGGGFWIGRTPGPDRPANGREGSGLAGFPGP